MKQQTKTRKHHINEIYIIYYNFAIKNLTTKNKSPKQMKKDKDLLKTGWQRLAMAIAVSASMVSFTSCTDKYDLDEHDPDGWGASIYSYLEGNGNYNTTIRLINDIGETYKDELAKTRSRTMFVADDEAYNRFFANNTWGVKRYEDLSLAQKKLLVLGSMIKNSYQVNNLSSIQEVVDGRGPAEGLCMRRNSSVGLYDSIMVADPAKLINTQPEQLRWNHQWRKFIGRPGVVLLKDASTAPMIHFIEDFMTNNKITNSDYDFLYDYKTNREPGQASVNGVQIIEPNIRCSNGFIHKMADVIMPLENMTEVIAKQPQFSKFHKMLERFAVAQYMGEEATRQYNEKFGTDFDSIYQKRYVTRHRQRQFLGWKEGQNGEKEGYEVEASAALKFDPGWNTYYAGLPLPSEEGAMQKNMAVMLVPTNTALDNEWETDNCKALRQEYTSWDDVPNDVLVKLINNNMQSSFVDAVPSKFAGLLNDANEPYDKDPQVIASAIDHVHLACNGAIYETNKVFTPVSYVSVLAPVIVKKIFKILNWAVDNNDFSFYLNSLNSEYSFFIPTNNAMLTYVDPVAYGKDQKLVYQFHWDDTNKENPVWATICEYDPETFTVGDSIGVERTSWNLRDRLKDLLENHIVVDNVQDGNTYFKTKGYQEIRVKNANLEENGMTVEGSYQINETRKPIKVTEVYKQDNGKCYMLDGEPILTTAKSVFEILSENPEMKMFADLLAHTDLLENGKHEKKSTAKDNISVFNTFNYTVYVPSNETLTSLHQSGELPTWEGVAQLESEGKIQAAAEDSMKIVSFLRRHIQDCSLFIGAQPNKAEEDGYETALINSNGKYERIYARLGTNSLKVRMKENESSPVVAEVDTSDPSKYNIMAREYIYDTEDKKDANRIFTSSTAVVHLIKGAIK